MNSFRKTCDAVIWVLAPLLAQTVQAAEPVQFQRDLAPVFERHCLRCHNDDDRRGGLSLHSAAAMKTGGDSGEVIVPGEPASSYLLDLVAAAEGEAEMPKDAKPLSIGEVDLLRRWVQDGAPWPKEVLLEAPQLWSLQPIARPTPPAVTPDVGESTNATPFSIRNPIDAFVARRHQEAGLTPAGEAGRTRLIRRLYLDLIGLPPSPVEVEAFVADQRPQAYERLVDALLASPHFGERWGRHWLDLARYADSEGYLGDAERPHAWVYREWVIAAINDDLPFDQFTIEQLAGDLLDQPTLDQRIATGFHRNTLRNTEAGVDRELYRTKEVVDRVDTTGMVWLGLTLGCAECHDHKHDPVTQSEFYQLYAFFNNANEVGVTATRPWERADYQRRLSDWQAAWDPLRSRLQSFQKPGLDAEIKRGLDQSLAQADRNWKWDKWLSCFRTEDDGWSALKKQVDSQLKARPAKPNTKARAFAQRTKDRRETYVHIRGVYNRRGERVEPGTPEVLPPLSPRGDEPDRRDLAVWLFEEENPLTARVAVNRIWQHLFGRGLVATPNDFGRQGAEPTHPQLLDWLATEYRRSGWSRKAMIRWMVTSSTYRLSSAVKAVPGQASTNNQLLWRQNSFRVSAETVRDLHLTASGLLDRTIGRRGIRPPLPKFVTEVGRSVAWPESKGGDRYRRGMYIFFKRTVPYPMLMTFDAPDAAISCSRRERSNTPLQALALLNDPVFFECAETLGKQAERQHPDDVQAAIGWIVRQCLGRAPTDREMSTLVAAHRDLQQLAQRGEKDGSHVPPLTAVARIVMNADEFITRD